MPPLPLPRRLALVKLDLVVAAALTAGIELETWFSGNAQGHRVALTIAGPFFTGAVALRRRYPASVGVGAGLLGSVMAAWWPSALLAMGIAWICDMYGFAVW